MTTKSPERLDTTSLPIGADRIAKLREDFPEIFRDGKVDLEALRRSLGDWIEPGKERFGLSWPGKAECMKVIQAPSVGTLQPMREESVEFDTTQNMIIEGDNLEVLKLLQKSYYGKVKMIYIDPPYNTGGEFIYPDRFQEGLKDYLKYSGQVDDEGFKVSTNTESGGRYHTNWLNMMYPRLFLARNLLRDDGVIFVSIDDHEVHNLRALMNEVFGEENFVEEFVWKKSYGGGAKERYVVRMHEYCLMFAKNVAVLDAFWLPTDQNAVRRYYTGKDEHFATKGPFRVKPLEATKSMDERENLKYSITAPDGSQISPKRQWWWGEDRVLRVKAENGLIFLKTPSGWTVSYKQYLKTEDGEERGVKPFSVIDKIYTQHGTSDLRTLFEGELPLQFPKPVALVEYLARISDDASGIVLDFFAGSGTTAQAIMKLNAEDRGTRRFILVQLPEKSDDPFATISAMTRERVRRAAKLFPATTDASDLFTEPKSPPDLGFRAYKLTTSNFRPWQGEAKSIASVDEQLEAFADHVLDGRSAEDLLTEILLKAGFDLATPVKVLKLAKKDVYSVAEGALLVCLDRALTLEVIEAMIDQKPSQIICLDAGFQNNDQLKVNAVQAIKSRARSEESTIVFKVV